MAEELSLALPGPLQIRETPGADCAQILSEMPPGCNLVVLVLVLAMAAPCLTWKWQGFAAYLEEEQVS